MNCFHQEVSVLTLQPLKASFFPFLRLKLLSHLSCPSPPKTSPRVLLSSLRLSALYARVSPAGKIPKTLRSFRKSFGPFDPDGSVRANRKSIGKAKYLFSPTSANSHIILFISFSSFPSVLCCRQSLRSRQISFTVSANVSLCFP